MHHNISRWHIVWLFIGCAGLLTGCNHTAVLETSNSTEDIRITLDQTEKDQTEDVADLSRGDLFTMFEEVNNETVVDFQYGDYNKDGTHEAFVLTNAEGYKLWYMHPAGCELVEEFTGEISMETDTIEYSTKKYFLLKQEQQDHPITIVYTLDNKNQIVEPVISRKGFLKKDSENQLVLRVYKQEDQKDVYCDYYLYYSLDEGFKEYGAIPIAKEQFLEFQGSSDILEQIQQLHDGVELDITYLYRSNQYMNVNWSFYEDGNVQYRHATLQYDNEKVKVVGKLEQQGKAEIANSLEIATFPTAFKHPNTRIDQ